MRWSVMVQELKLAHAFTLSRGSSTLKHNVFVKLDHEGVQGYGEAAPNIRYNETPESARAAVQEITARMVGSPHYYATFLAQMDHILPGEQAAKAAVDAAVMDWVGKQHQVPLYRLWGLEPEIAPTSMTVAIDQPEEMARRALEATDFSFLKIKLGTPNDRHMIRAIRQVSSQILRVDANEGWTDREQAAREIDWLAGQNVELVEQPMPAARVEDMIWLKSRSALPLIADEAFSKPADLPQVAQAYHGVNVKLAKTGGTLAARNALAMARALDLKTMVGCMIESGLGVAAAAHLAPGADYVDLDGNLLLSEDPFPGHPVERGCFMLKNTAGLGVDASF